jgi:hypothetical protein
VWIGYKRLILKLSKVLRVGEVKGPYMHPNQRLIVGLAQTSALQASQ